MSGIKDIAALDAKLRSMSIADRKALLNSAVTGLNNMVGERYDLGKRLLDRQQAGKQNLGKEFKAKGGIVGFANGDMVNLFGGQAPKYRIDPRYYDSPEYKKRQKEKQAGEIAGMAMTYSPYFGMAGSTAIGKDDAAYEAYVKRIGGNPKADYMDDVPKGLSKSPEEAGYKGFPKAYAAVEPQPGFMYAYDSEGERYSVPKTYFDTDAPKFMPPADKPKTDAAPPPTGGTMEEFVERFGGEDGKFTLDDLIDAGLVPDDRGLGKSADPEKVSTVATTQPVDQTFDPNATTSDVAAENIATTTATTTGTQPDPKDANINLGDIGEAALPVLGTAALDAVLGDGEIDWKQALTAGVGVGQALGLDLFDKLGAPAGGDPKAGYQGKIPTYVGTRRQVPVDYATDRRPGSGGRRYFTDMRYTTPENAGIAATNAAQDALALQQMNQANPLNQPPVRTQPVEQPMARGGYAYAPGGLAGMMPSRYLNSMADGMADSIPSSIDNKDPAALSGGEFVVAADVVSGLGNGNSNAGAQQLYNMMDRVRKARTGTTKQGKQIKPQSVMPV
tara:strand:- start:451 stop:2130 length:1680 start_codon:yes stop_codon:yes gene_type:complete